MGYHGNSKILLPWGVPIHRVFFSVASYQFGGYYCSNTSETIATCTYAWSCRLKCVRLGSIIVLQATPSPYLLAGIAKASLARPY